MGTGSTAAELLARAHAERAAGRGADAARLYAESAAAAREADDLEGWGSAALGAASVQVFGTEPGRLPAVLYDVLVRTTDDRMRARLAAALARCWVYSSEAARAVPFSDEALVRARRVGDPALIADALDAALTTRWGPDDIVVRRALSRDLDEVVAHVTDPDARLQAHLWGLHVACENLDVPAMRRQMRALEVLGQESPRARFFAGTRRAMLDLMQGRTDRIDALCRDAHAATEESFIPDGWMVLACVDGYAAIQQGDVDRVREMAVSAEAFGVDEGVTTVLAEVAYCWTHVDLERARSLLRNFHGSVLTDLPRDVNWLLDMQLILEVALAVDDVEEVRRAADLLAPYADRAVVNAGAVMFHGTTDDPLSRAFALLGRDEEAAVLRQRALATYERIGATWWHDRLSSSSAPTTRSTPDKSTAGVHLHPTDGGLWLIGADATPVAALRGFEYLRVLVAAPGRAVTALDLVGTRGPVVEETGVGETIDRQALAAYRDRLRDIDAEIAEAEDWADPARLDDLRDERDALLAEVGRATGIGGRVRTSGSSQERARVAVKKALSTAITKIGELDDALGHHLRVSVHTGLTCTYEPEPGAAPDWVLDQNR